MATQYFAVPLEVCEVEGYICDMGEYDLVGEDNIKDNFYEQCKKIAKEMVTGYVEVYKYENGECEYQGTYEYDEYKCKCTEEHGGFQIVEEE